MKRIAYYLLLLSLLSPALCKADRSPVTHRFATMSNPSEIAFSNYNTVARTNLLTYTCSGGAAFGASVVSPYTAISINFSKSTHVMTTTAIDSLSGIQIWHYPYSAATTIKVELSRDSVHWTAPLSQEHMYETEYIRATFVPGRYYVRLRSSSSTKVAVYQIEYTFGACNCVMYIPE